MFIGSTRSKPITFSGGKKKRLGLIAPGAFACSFMGVAEPRCLAHLSTRGNDRL
ncbi:hypothetical protein D9M71_264030 [compost metagenome]